MADTTPWIKKYQPKTSKEIIGQDPQVQQIKQFIANFKKERKKALLIYGNCGIGKTASLYAIASETNLETIELNASDARNENAITTILGTATKQQSLFFRGKLIIIDEIDGLSGTKDRGGIGALTNVIKETRFPIIVTAINPFDSKFSELRRNCQLIEFNDLNYLHIFQKLQEVATKESLLVEETALKSLARQAGGDMRAAINDLQILTAVKKTLTIMELEELQQRRKTESMPAALVKVFKVKDPLVAISAFNDVDEDDGKQMLWIDENLPKEYVAAEDLIKAYDALSKADVFKGRIRRWQHWRFLVYVNALMTVGVALAKKERKKEFIQYTPTERILTLWKAKMKYEKRNNIAEKIAKKTHTSKRYAIQHVMPYMKKLFEHSYYQKQELAHELDLDPDEVAWMSTVR